MSEPSDGDLILRGCAEHGFSVVDATSGHVVVGPVPLGRAVEVALAHAPGDLWHQRMDARGALVGQPILMLRRR